MTALIDPARHAVPRHRRVVEDTTDDVGVPVVAGWLDPETAPLAVYRDRDLPYAPLAVQRDRARVAAASVVPVAPAVSAAPAVSTTPTGAASAPVDRRGRARVAAVAVLALVVVLAAVAVVLLSGGPPGGRPGPGGAPTGSAQVLPARTR